MKKITIVAALPFFAGFLWAQAISRTGTTATYNGTLMDAGCVSKQTEVTDCPVTTTTTTFALHTPEGKYVRFDDASNTRIIEVVKGNKVWSQSINDHKPIQVRVAGTPNGDVVVMESIR